MLVPPPPNLPEEQEQLDDHWFWITYAGYWENDQAMDTLGGAVVDWMAEILAKTPLVRISTRSGYHDRLQATLGAVLEKGQTTPDETVYLYHPFDITWVVDPNEGIFLTDPIEPTWTTPLRLKDSQSIRALLQPSFSKK